MEKIIEFKNNNFGYNINQKFNDFNMAIEKKDIVSLVGSANSGKTTLLKMLCHRLPNECCYYNNQPFETIDVEVLKKEVVVVFDMPTSESDIKSEITKYLYKLGINQEEINLRYGELDKLFNLAQYENIKFAEIPFPYQSLIKILRFLIIGPKFIAIDNLFGNLYKEDKDKLIKYIKEKEITLLNVITNLEDALYGNKMKVLDNFTLILEGTTASVLKTDTLLKRLGFTLPLPVDLSIELIHYDVLKKIYTDSDKLVGALWK